MAIASPKKKQELAKQFKINPDINAKLDAFMKDGVFGWDTDEWVTGGCLTWQANDGKVWHPADARAARAAKEESGVQPS